MGAWPVFVDVGTPVDGLVRQCRRLGGSGIITDNAMVDITPGLVVLPMATSGDGVTADADNIDLTAGRFGPDDVAYLQLTSGTRGEPQASMITHRALDAQLDALELQLRLSPSDRGVKWMPLHHDFALVLLLFSPLRCGYVVHHIQPRLHNLGRWLELIDSERASDDHRRS